jgi:hypothetical protein
MSGAQRNRRYRECRQSPPPPPPALAEARLRGLEYELLRRRELFHIRTPIEAELRQIAAALRTGLAGFPARYGPAIAAELDVPVDRPAGLLQRVFDDLITELGGEDGMERRIVETLDKAAARWGGSPLNAASMAPIFRPGSHQAAATRRKSACAVPGARSKYLSFACVAASLSPTRKSATWAPILSSGG